MFYNTNSPLMKTPYLDASSNDTPFIDAISPPFIDSVTDFYYPTLSYPPKKSDDVCIANYLNQPAVSFNGDPSLLLIDKSKTPLATHKPSPTVKLETLGEESHYDNTLFPPLQQRDVQREENHPIDMDFIKSEGMSLDELLGFDASSPLTEVLDDEPQEEEPQPQQEQEIKEESQIKEESKTSRKRKSSSVTTSNNAAAKKPRVAKPKEIKLYQCPLCDHKSKRRYNLSTHIKTHDKNRVKEFDCSLCSKSFDRRHDRDRHLATVHRKERTHGCQHCINQFSRKDALNRHLVQKHGYDEADLEED